MTTTSFNKRAARTAPIVGLLLCFLWINISEVFRYFIFVLPMTRATMSHVPDIAPMNIPVFLIWGFWDTLLVAVVVITVRLVLDRLGGGLRNMLIAGTLPWLTFFCLFWLGLWNMNLTVARIPLVALPLAWLEMVVAAAIIDRTRQPPAARPPALFTQR